MGRQVFVVFLVFFCAKLTTIHMEEGEPFLIPAPWWFRAIFLETGRSFLIPALIIDNRGEGKKKRKSGIMKRRNMNSNCKMRNTATASAVMLNEFPVVAHIKLFQPNIKKHIEI